MEFGFLNINKPLNCTSHDVITLLRKSLGIKKIGHCGTLDPFATGVLIVGINDATKLLEYLPSDKTYIAKIVFGVETNTNDITGEVLKRADNIPSLKEIKENLKSYIGQVKQKPPIFSAIKINGHRSYNLARQNKISIEHIKEKTIEIYSSKILSYVNNELLLEIHCSKGTYIRSIARDLGYTLNTYAILSSLQRVKIGSPFTIENSIDPKLITKLTLKEYLIASTSALQLQKIYLSSEQVKDISLGKSIKTVERYNDAPLRQLLDNNNKLVAVGTLTEDCSIKPKKVFVK